MKILPVGAGFFHAEHVVIQDGLFSCKKKVMLRMSQ